MNKSLLIGGIALLGLSAILLTGGLILFILPPTFESAAKLLIKLEISGAGSSAQHGSGEASVSDGTWVQTEVEKLQSKMVLYPVITNLDLSRKWGEKFKEGELQAETAYAMLRGQVQVRSIRGVNVFEIRVQSDDPAEASAIANGIAESYRSQRIASERERMSLGSNALAGDARILGALMTAASAVQIIDQAEPNLRPVKPHRLVKLLVPVAGLLAGVLGIVLLTLAVVKAARARRSSSPHLPT